MEEKKKRPKEEEEEKEAIGRERERERGKRVNRKALFNKWGHMLAKTNIGLMLRRIM